MGTPRRQELDMLGLIRRHVATAHFVGRMIASGGYTCSVDGIVSGA